jgi:YHS domain-containing protein
MPGKVTDAEEQRLYLEPDGLYTEEDIAANGNRTASEAFVNFKARHDFNPQPGDAICPVTRTKANPECQWIIGGQAYQFCCPPCVDEFVILAKSDPEKIRPPEAYVQE